MSYHNPVMLNESVDGLDIKKDGIYVDVTYGGGGHSKEILKRLGDKGRLIAFDQDADVEANVVKDERLVLVPQNFRYLKNYLKMYGIQQIDGLLADLGVSSHQFDVGERGFSIRFDGPLDMRMSKSNLVTAAKIVNEYSEDDLVRLFREYGEINNAKKLVFEIVSKRMGSKFKTTTDLIEVAEKLVPGKMKNKYLAQVFQALRIEVNSELDVLKDLLMQSKEVIKPSGRLVVITYHSLEDRLVKNFLKNGSFSGELEKDFFGNQLVDFKLITRKPLTPSNEELQLNNRARSAKLRIAERVDSR
ncbi:MAG: Ribosomal RNA small subunit methyltransferase H [Flavobacteriales bacterium]|nr:MAG: 16S rRNA (cytosine(1402)-N(4))-methyltransferase RsmH [Flavobacteriales bacterium]MBV6484992.1 Ribosomal RNA small subunit methyltransferase H [Flavobacteriales bacterium]